MITIDDADPTPAFEQIRQQLTVEIRSGNLSPGDRLPSVRQLAGDLRVAAGTVARAYSTLEAHGLIESTRLGTRVRAFAPLSPAAREAARRFVSVVPGLTLDDAILAVRVEWARRA